MSTKNKRLVIPAEAGIFTDAPVEIPHQVRDDRFSMSDCIFCKINKKEIPCKVAYENEDILAFHDISPQAKTHILVIPKKHYSTLNSVESENLSLLSKMYDAVQKIVKEQKIDQSGYRCVINTNSQGGQTVFHLHLHILGGEQLGGGMVG